MGEKKRKLNFFCHSVNIHFLSNQSYAPHNMLFDGNFLAILICIYNNKLKEKLSYLIGGECVPLITKCTIDEICSVVLDFQKTYLLLKEIKILNCGHTFT